MQTKAPRIVVLAGPNGSGKSTSAFSLLRGSFSVDEFVNADTIAQGLSGMRPEDMAISAGRIMLARLRQLASVNMDFAFESTLASRSFAPWIRDLKSRGYAFHQRGFVTGCRREVARGRVAARLSPRKARRRTCSTSSTFFKRNAADTRHGGAAADER